MVVQRHDVVERLILGQAEEAAEQAGVGGDGVLPDDEGRAVRDVVCGERPPTPLEFNVVP